MIYTVTFNPAVDYIVRTKALTAGAVNRSESEEIYFGGKGINVSLVLSELGVKSKALGFVAGFTGEAIEKGITEKGIDADFVHLEKGFSRINVKIKSDEETELNGQGPEITAKAIDLLFTKLDSLKAGDTLVLAGSIPSSLPSDIYEPNNFELGEMFGVELKTNEDIIKYAGKLREKGAVNVLISMAGDGAILLDEHGKTHICGVCKGKVRNSVGAGDAMVAGFIAGCENGDYEYALKLGTASGGATAFSDGLAEKKTIDELMEQLA